MQERENEQHIRLALVEAAAQLPAVRALTDPDKAANTALVLATVWYNYVVEGTDGEPTSIKDIL